VCLDIGHAHVAGDPAEAMETLSGYVTVVHLNDNQGREDSHRAPYSGSVDWPLTLMALWKTGFAGPAVVEMTPDPDVSTSLLRAIGARTRLQAILDDLALPMVFPE
jgi:sugar phosphate isomerase/epimerase